MKAAHMIDRPGVERQIPANNVGREAPCFGSNQQADLRSQCHARDLRILVGRIPGPHRSVLTDDASYTAMAAVVAAFGAEFHADHSFEANPPSSTLLRLVKTPDYGGGTIYNLATTLYDKLSPHFQNLFDGLRAAHTSEQSTPTSMPSMADEGRFMLTWPSFASRNARCERSPWDTRRFETPGS